MLDNLQLSRSSAQPVAKSIAQLPEDDDRLLRSIKRKRQYAENAHSKRWHTVEYIEFESSAIDLYANQSAFIRKWFHIHGHN